MDVVAVAPKAAYDVPQQRATGDTALKGEMRNGKGN